MKLIITILGEGYQEDVLNVDGQSGTIYPFAWNSAAGRYEHAPATQEAIDDIFQSQTINSLFFFSAVVVEGQGGTGVAPVRSVPRPALDRKYYADLDADELAAVCADAGVVVPDACRGNRAAMLGLVDAYWLGAGYKQVHGAPAAEPADVDLAAVDDEPAAARPRRRKPAGV